MTSVPNVLDARRMGMMMETAIVKRQQDMMDEGGEQRDERIRDEWWFTSTAYIVKWSVLFGIFLLFFLWFVGGYYHAKARVRAGKRPLAYHRWLLPKSMQPGFQPTYATPYNRPYGLQRYPEPPPVYEPNGMPPVYYPPTKPFPEQQVGVQEPPPEFPRAPAQQGNYPEAPPPAAGSAVGKVKQSMLRVLRR